MSLRQWLSDIIAPAESAVKDGVATIEHASWTSSRLWVIAAFIGLLVWINHGLVDETIRYAFWCIIAYIASNTVTRTAQILANSRILSAQATAPVAATPAAA